MNFTSLTYIIFFLLVLVFFNLIPQKGKVWLLLLASYTFYTYLQPVYVLLLIVVTLCTHQIARKLVNMTSEQRRSRMLFLGVFIILLPLLFFKYFGAINELLSVLINSLGISFSPPKTSWLLPVGISYYTFMAIGYIVDVYNEEVEFESNIGSTGLFLSFFPIILSGPIERAGNLLPQFKSLRNSKYEDLAAGARMILWGYFVKLCIADRLGIYVDDIYHNIPLHNGTTLAVATMLYAFQIYTDLAGYTLIAIGSARCLGIEVIPNFNRPFFSTSMTEFWRRFHMSLIQWLRDYIFTPLSFYLRGWRIWGIVAALMLTFLISGLWHGATLTFVVWGLLQGTYLSMEALTQKRRARLEQKLKLKKNPLYLMACSIIVFLLFAFSEIFGKANSVRESFTVIYKIFSDVGVPYLYMTELSFGLVALVILLLHEFLEEYFPGKIKLFNNRSTIVRYLSYLFVIFFIILLGEFSGQKFIYFQF